MEDTQASTGFGRCFERLADRPPGPCPARDELPGGPGLTQLAAQTPFLTRMRALLERLRGGRTLDVRRAHQLLRKAVDGPASWLGMVRCSGLVSVLLMAAVEHELVEVLEDHRGALRVGRGSAAALVRGHPLAAWGEPMMTASFQTPVEVVECDHRWYDERLDVFVPLVHQRLVIAGSTVALDGDAELLRDEIAQAAGPSRPAPTRAEARDRMADAAALLAEFGVVHWEPAPSGAGRCRISALGLFGWVLQRVGIDGELPPSLHAELAERGYLRAEGGYIAPDALPVRISNN